MRSSNSGFIWCWRVALLLFVVAAATGSWLRFGMLYGLPEGFYLHNLRHAHSHLMYFGWATPAFMALIAASLPQVSGRPQPRRVRAFLTALFILAALAYVAFLLYGYQPVRLGSASLPLATIGAAFNVLAWYVFIIIYRNSTKGAPRYMALRFWDASLVFMILASCGAWGLAIATVLGVSSAVLSLALTHLFLDLFADGWFLLALLGAAALSMPQAANRRFARSGENLLIAGLPLTFLLSLPAGALPITVRIVAGISALAAAAGLVIVLASFARELNTLTDRAQRWLWGAAFFFLSLKAVAFLIVSLPAGAAWSARMGLRLSYLHWLLLGGVSLGLVAAARARWGSRAVALWQPLIVTIIILIASLVPLSWLWPAGLGGRWTLVFAAWATVGPVVVVVLMLLVTLVGERKLALQAHAAEIAGGQM